MGASRGGWRLGDRAGGGQTYESLSLRPCSPAPLRLLTIETTCDETAAAVVTDRLEVLSSVVASQDRLHERFGGVVPEIASRAHVERILPVIDEALRKAGVTLADLDAVAVANTPGLAGSLLGRADGGQDAVRRLRLAAGGRQSPAGPHLRLPAGERPRRVSLRRPDRQRRPFEHLPLRRPIDFTPLGGTIDDAAGEAFDKVASLLGLPYPGGPAIERAARDGDRKAHRFPRPLLDDPDAARLQLQRAEDGRAVSGRRAGKAAEPSEHGSLRQLSRIQLVADIAASFQEAVIDCLVGKAELALEQDRLSNALRRRRRRGQWPVPRAAGGIGRQASATSCTFRRSRSAPTTP